MGLLPLVTWLFSWALHSGRFPAHQLASSCRSLLFHFSSFSPQGLCTRFLDTAGATVVNEAVCSENFGSSRCKLSHPTPLLRIKVFSSNSASFSSLASGPALRRNHACAFRRPNALFWRGILKSTINIISIILIIRMKVKGHCRFSPVNREPSGRRPCVCGRNGNPELPGSAVYSQGSRNKL
jgi:hypothetical protein